MSSSTAAMVVADTRRPREVDMEHDNTSDGTSVEERALEDELIRAYLLAQAREWAEYQGKYGWLGDLDVGAKALRASD
jgi:hypothetical protein